MAISVKPRTLAVIFGVYFLLVAYFTWTFANGLTYPWFHADITRWVYTSYMLVAAIFLVGLGGIGLSMRRFFSRQIRELDARIERGFRQSMSEAMPPPLPETAPRDHVDRDIDELLESLSEVEASAVQEARAMDVGAEMAAESSAGEQPDPGAAARRERLVQRRNLLGKFVAGPGVVAAVILGLSGMMLPGSDEFAQSQFALNTALILGIGYSWIGVGAYIATTIAALVSSRAGGRK